MSRKIHVTMTVTEVFEHTFDIVELGAILDRDLDALHLDEIAEICTDRLEDGLRSEMEAARYSHTPNLELDAQEEAAG